MVANRTIKLKDLPEIIELYATEVDLDTGEVGDTISTFLKPRKPLAEFTVGLTGITQEMVDGAPMFVDISDKAVAMLERAKAVIAHNVRFDCDMIEIELERLERTIKWPQVLCTVEQSIHYQGRRLTLTLLYEYLFPGEKFEAHRADSDVGALMRICIEMRKRGDL